MVICISLPFREFKGDIELMGWDTYNFPKEMSRQGVSTRRGGREGGGEGGGEEGGREG